jgi:RNA polymerase sigma-70 factor, ECF subfamily
VLVLHDIEALVNREIAAMLRLSLPAVKSRLHRSRLFVRKRLREYFESALVA